MHTMSRPTGRFFAVLIVWLAWVAPRAMAADGAGFGTPKAPSVWGTASAAQIVRGEKQVFGLRSSQPEGTGPGHDDNGKSEVAWLRSTAKLPEVGSQGGAKHTLRSALPPGLRADFGNIKLTTISDTVYNADGTLAKGYLVISWPAFTTATQAVVAAGSLSVRLGPDGLFIGRLAPTAGSTPTGVYYTVVYQLGDGSSKQEYWAVPDTDNTTISAVRAKLMPTSTAAQFLTRDLADSVYVHVNDDQTVGGVKTFSKSPAVPDPQKATDTVNKEYGDASYVHVNDNQTVGGVKTFSRSPVVPDPQNPTEVANKEYVDANAGTANLDSPPPIGRVRPNTITGSSITASAGATGDSNFNAIKTWVQDSGEVDWDFLKKDGSVNLRGAYFLPWFQMPNMNPGILYMTTPIFPWEFVGGITALGRYNSFQLLDPGAGSCTVTHSGAGGSGATYTVRFFDSNSGPSLASPPCSDAQGYSYAELVGGHGTKTNTLTYHQPTGGNGKASAGYANMLPSRGTDPVGNVVDDPGHQAAGVISTLTSCGNESGCSWVDDGSWGNTTLQALMGAYFNSPDRNATDSMILNGRFYGQGGAYLSGGTVLQGRTVGNTLADPPAPTVKANVGGSTSYTYYIVYHDFGGGATNVSAPKTINNGAANPNNSISWNCYPLYFSADLLKGDTSHALATNLPCAGINDGSSQPYVFTDTGQSTSAYSAPYRNSTADLYMPGAITSGSGVYGQFLSSPVIYGTDGASGHGFVTCNSGDSAHSGFCKWFNTSGAATFTLGYDTGNDLTLTPNSGGNFSVATALTANSIAVAGDLTARDIPGHAYFVSKYPSIQAAINAAYGSGTVSGAVIDDRTATYSGPGFYIPDSVKVQLAPVPYTFTSAVTHNNGNNNVTAAIVVEQGAHLAGGGTSSNHGTTITVGSGFGNDIIATTSVGTGTGAGVQWWHWGSIEDLNVDGANQTAGECVHVENMGETSKVHDLLVKNCYSNNIEFAGAAATQSDIANLSTSRSRNGSGVRFTNLSGVGKINGLSGDCNAGSLVSVQENAAGTLTITGLKSEAESTICANGSSQDPAILLDTLAGLNTHVHVIGGYAFGTAQNALVKVVGSGGGIFEMEGFYVTGYTNLINDTTRSVVVPSTSSNSKQPFFYEPNGIVFANQAFTLTPGTGVMGGSTAITPIFYATTGNATMVASLGNGDGESIMTGGVELAGQNRIMYGATPEVMARAGYRFTGSGYDTTKWDFVPAWNTGDATEKNLGNSLNVCQKNGSVSCRWNHIYGVNADALVFTLGTYTVATLPAGYSAGSMTWVSDGASASDCSTGHGSTRVLCYYSGSAWTAMNAGGGAVWGSITGTLSNQTDLQNALNGKAASNASMTVNGVTCALGSSCAPGMHLVSGTMVGPQSGIVGNGGDQNVFSVTIPAGTTSAGTGFKCYARWAKSSNSNAVTYKWVLGGTTLATQSVGASSSGNWLTDIEIFTPSSLSSQVASVSPLIAGTAIQSGPQVGLTASENLANAATLKLTFNAASSETITPKTFYCTTVR